MGNAKQAISNCHKLIYETENICKYLEDFELSTTKKTGLSTRENQMKKAVVNSYLVKKPKQISKEDISSSLNCLHTAKNSEVNSKMNLTDELTLQSPLYLEENLSAVQNIINLCSPILVELSKKLLNYETRLRKFEDGAALPIAGTLPSGKIDEMKRGKQFKIASSNKSSNDWISNVNIGNIMHLLPLNLEDLAITPQIAHEICKDALYEKIIMTAIAYFSIATECRFLCNEGNNELYQSESKYWHRAAVELVCTFLPNECPLVNHIISSYEKHNTLAQEVIVKTNIKP